MCSFQSLGLVRRGLFCGGGIDGGLDSGSGSYHQALAGELGVVRRHDEPANSSKMLTDIGVNLEL
jgi:hypothetical protein